MRPLSLLHLDGRPWLWTQFDAGTPAGAAWDWIAEQVAAEHEVCAEDIDCIETDDGDTITVCGVPTYRMQWDAVTAPAAPKPEAACLLH
jgi:hypothetical protein